MDAQLQIPASKPAPRAASFTPVRPGLLQRKCACGGVPSIVHEVLSSQGKPLDSLARATMERRFGHDFSDVRVHEDARAAASAEAVSAFAYTVGRDVVFGSGQYSPDTPAGQRLLAHELAHVIQQGGGAVSGTAPLRLSPPGDSFEQEADRAADSGRDRVGRLSRSPASLQRTVKFVEGKVREDVNLAEVIATRSGSAGNTDFVLNGTAFAAGTSWQTELQALNTPGLDSQVSPKGNGVSCWFNSEPYNEVSYEMRVPAPEPWTFVGPKASLPFAGCGGGGNATLVLRSDGAQGKRTLTHENQHVVDYKAIFKDVLVPWDKRVAAVHQDNPTAMGADPAACESNLYRANVGPDQTPAGIVRRIITEINSRARAFHRSPAGRDVIISNVQTGGNCDTVTAEVS